MALDAYSLCPCGSGKKVKFCCPREHISDYLKVFELIDAEQFAAAAELTDRLVAKAPQQACFLALQATFVDPSEEDAVRQMAARLQSAMPEHPTTKAALAVKALHDGNFPQAIELIQDSIERLESAVPTLLMTAIGTCAELALHEDRVWSALALATYALTLTKGRHSGSMSLLREVRLQPGIPLPVKDEWLQRLQAGLPGKMDARITALTIRGKWRRARVEATAWRQRQPDNPCAAAMLAILSGNLGDNQTAADYWRQFADAPEVPDHLAADAHTVADFMSRIGYWTLTQCVIPVQNVDGLMEQLLSSRRNVRSKRDLSEMAGEDEPPPKALFHVLDRDPQPVLPETRAVDLPIVLFDLCIYGRQTDREARVEFVITDEPDRGLLGVARDLLGSFAAGPETTEQIGTVPSLASGLLEKRYIPDDTNIVEASRLDTDEANRAVYEVWPQRRDPMLLNKTPLEAAGDPQMHARLLAATLALQNLPPFDLWPGDFTPIWEKVGLTQTVSISSLDDAGSYGLNHLIRLDVSGVGDEDLAKLTQLAVAVGARRAGRRFGALLIERPEARRDFDLSEIFEFLKFSSQHPAERLTWNEAAIAWAREVGKPEGTLLVEQMLLKTTMEQTEEAHKLMQELMTNHRQDQEAMQALFQFLHGMGLIGPDGRVRELPEAKEAAPATGGGLWTPDQPQPSGETKSKLWVPGMD